MQLKLMGDADSSRLSSQTLCDFTGTEIFIMCWKNDFSFSDDSYI